MSVHDLKHHLYWAADIVKRTKKADLVDVIARRDLRHEEELEKAREPVAALRAERDGLRRELRALSTVRDFVRVIVGREAQLKAELSPQQLTFCLHKDREDLGDNAVETALAKLLDNVEKFLEEFGGGWGAPTYDDLANALDAALGDRDMLLAKLRLTDAEWSAQGGYSHTDVEV